VLARVFDEGSHLPPPFEVSSPFEGAAQGPPIEAAEAMKFGDVSPLLPQIQKFNKPEQRGCADAEQFRGTLNGPGSLIRRKHCVSCMMRANSRS
jgi:hypothetical protein